LSVLGGNSLSCLLLQSAVASRSLLPVLVRCPGCEAAAELLICFDPRRVRPERLRACPDFDHLSAGAADRLGAVCVDALHEGRQLGAHPRQQVDLHGNGGHLPVAAMATHGTGER
jgi:streptomycin 6-kinase